MGIKWMIKKSDYNEIRKSINKDSSNKKLEALKKEVIAILEKKDSQELKKAIEYFEKDEKSYSHLEKSVSGEWIEKAGYGVGTVRIWKGKKYKKVSASPTRWVRVFDKEDRGAKSSMTRLINYVKTECDTPEKLYQFCLSHHALFQDDNGVDLPIMDKLRAAIDEQKGKVGDELDSSKHFQYKDKENKPAKKKESEKYDDDKAFEEYKALVIKDNLTKEERTRVGELVLEHFKHSKKGWPGGAKLKAESFNSKESEDNHYWIQDSKGNRLTNESAKKRIKASYDEIDKIKDKMDSMDKADKVHADLDIRKLQYDINNLMDKLNGDDRKEMESEAEKHQNRSDAMKGNQNARKYGNIEVDDKNMKTITNVMVMSNEDIDNAIKNFEKEINERPNGYLAQDYKERIKIFKNEKEQRKIGANNLKDDEQIPGIYSKDGLNTISKVADALGISNDEARKRITKRWSNSDWGNDPMKRYLDINDSNGKGYAGIPDFSQPLYDNAVKEVVEDYFIDKLNIKDADNLTYNVISEEAYDAVHSDTSLNQAEKNIKKRLNKSDSNVGNNVFEESPIAKAVEKYASDKQIKNTVDKVSSDDIASTDPTRMFMNGTFHEDGYEIATDGHMLSMIKSDYPTDDEGKIKATPKAIKEMDKTLKTLNKKLTDSESELKAVENKVGRGSYNYQIVSKRIEDLKEDIANAEKSKETGVINGTFPNYKKVIPSLGNTSDLEPASGFEDFNKILKVAKVAAAYNKAKKEKASVKVGDYNFDPNLLINTVAMAEKHGLKNVNFRPNSYNPAQSPIEFSGDNGYVVIMPMGNDSGRTTFDAATGNVDGNMTTSGRYVTDDIKDFLGVDGNSNKEVTEEDKLKAETKAEKESRTASQETKEKLYEDIPSGVTEQNYKKYIDMGTKLYTKWGYDMNDPRQQKQLKNQINDIVQRINNKDFDILESLESSSNIFTRTIWMMQTGGISPDKAGVEKYFGKEATEKHNKELEEKKAIYEQKKAEDEKRRLTDKVNRTFDKEHINYGKLSSPESRETFINYLSSLPPNRQESALNRLSKDLIRYKKDGKEKVSFMLDYIIDQIDDGTSIDTIKTTYRDVRSKPIVSFAQWYADSKIGVKKSVLLNDFDEIIEVYEDTDLEDESYSDYDASQPDLFNSTSYKVGAALDSIFGC